MIASHAIRSVMKAVLKEDTEETDQEIMITETQDTQTIINDALLQTMQVEEFKVEEWTNSGEILLTEKIKHLEHVASLRYHEHYSNESNVSFVI